MYLIACQDLSTVSIVQANGLLVDERSSGSSLGLSITYYTGHYQIRFIHDGTKGHSESIAKLSSFMNSTRGFSVDVTVGRF